MSATPQRRIELHRPREAGWQELWLKEDWWAVWLGLGLVVIAFALFAGGSSIAWIAVAPAKWSTFSELGGQLAANAPRYFAQFGLFLVVFTIATSVIGHRARTFIPSFLFIYLLSVAIFAVGAWDQAQRYNLEPPLVALLLGLLIANLIVLPRWLDAGFRVEFYIKVGIVLLGATLPFTLIIWAGPIAILQASIVSIVTFLVIFFVGRRLGLDHQLSATLGAGGAVCGVSAAIAVAAAVRKKGVSANRDHPGDLLGNSVDLCASTGFSRATAANRCRRSLDRDVRICRCRRFRCCPILWRNGRSWYGHIWYGGSSNLGLYTDQSGRP